MSGRDSVRTELGEGPEGVGDLLGVAERGAVRHGLPHRLQHVRPWVRLRKPQLLNNSGGRIPASRKAVSTMRDVSRHPVHTRADVDMGACTSIVAKAQMRLARCWRLKELASSVARRAATSLAMLAISACSGSQQQSLMIPGSLGQILHQKLWLQGGGTGRARHAHP